MIEVAFFGLLFLLTILFSGFFLWIGLRLIGKRKGILEAGLANLAAGIFASIILLIVAAIPLFGVISPIVGYFAYLYALKAILDINLLEAFVVSIVSSLVFFFVSVLIATVLGVWLFKYTM
ncbi:hypothetical protein DRO97_05305, partial [Archaeoglobales archaeon]